MFVKLGVRKDGFQRMRALAEMPCGNRISVSEKLDYEGAKRRLNFDMFYNGKPVKQGERAYKKFHKEYCAIITLVQTARDCAEFKPFVLEV